MSTPISGRKWVWEAKLTYRPDPEIHELGDEFYDPVQAANFPFTTLRYRNTPAAASVGLDHLSDEQWIEHFGLFTPLADNLPEPLALRYHGHQFRHYNPDLGDGRGFLFAQLRSSDNRLLDLGTKGSGTTPYSRAGDGRLTLLGGVREVLATAYLEHLGVNTSKSFSLIETGEKLERNDEPSPTRSAVLVRLSHSHIRFGTFQRHAYFQDTDNLEALVQYCIKHFYPGSETVADMLSAVVKASANTVASWMAAGFVHGVMNTDNMNITGESFDYGPYRFLATLKSGFTAAYFDRNGLYAFAKQPEAMYWNLGQLTQSLSLIYDQDPLIKALESFAQHYRTALRSHVFRRLGITPTDLDTDIKFIMQTFTYLEKSQAIWPRFWHDWEGGAAREKLAMKGPNADFYKDTTFTDWLTNFKTYEPNIKAPSSEAPPSLLYDEIAALWAPIDEHDDWLAFNAKIKSFNNPL
jgi:uncharacterized protein YdiU (UPF0061 family)